MPRRLLIAFAAACLCAPLGVASGAAAAVGCGVPGGDWQKRSPAELGLDPAKLQQALDATKQRNTDSVAVYRHGCLAGEERSGDPDQRFESYSMAKSVVALAAMRAMTLHLLSPDDRVGGVVPQADRPHGALTVRELLTQSSGLHWNFFRDYNVFMPRDRVTDALTLRFDHRPGTWFEYAQSPVALMAEVVARAAGEDFAKFVQDQLFSQIGIFPGAWSWERDAAGHIQGFFGLSMRDHTWARLGQLLLDDGYWRGKRVIATRWVREATAPSPTNGGYGWYIWVNEGHRFVEPTVDRRDERDRSIVASAPPDMYLFAGLLEQRIIVIPSRDMVIVRLGVPGSQPAESDPFSYALTTGSGELDHELVRGVMRAVVDKPYPDAGPYQPKGPSTQPTPDYGFQKSATEQDDLDAARNAPPLPPSGPARARALQLLTPRAHLRRDGRVWIKYFCPPRTTLVCSGPLTIRGPGDRVAARARFRLKPGQKRILKLRLSRALRRRLSQSRLQRMIVPMQMRGLDSIDGTPTSDQILLVGRHIRRRGRH
jgi:CubicO group peptidase (beta-lactamase class C family)